MNLPIEYKGMLPPLYARGKNNKVLIWQIETEDNKFRVTAGQLDGKKVCSEWTICSGKNLGKKNATTGETQAAAEALAKWEKKQKSEGYWLDIKDIDKNKFFEPILAKNYKDYQSKIDFTKEEWGYQNKFNGFCCIAQSHGFYTRTGETYQTIKHIENDLEFVFQQYDDLILQGELFNPEYKNQLNEISKLVRKTVHITEEDLKKSESIVRYFVYDGHCISAGWGPDTPYKIRKQHIDEIVKTSKNCCLVPTTPITCKEDLDKEFQVKIDNNEEGLILRKMDMIYKSGRSKQLLKYKAEESDEAIIINIESGVGNWFGAGKIITLKWKDKVFNASFKGSFEQGVEFLKNKNQWIGKEVQFLYLGLTGLGVPASARVDINNCCAEK